METEVFPHVWHYVSSKRFLQQARDKTEDSLYPLLASMLFSAFCFEAYLNFLGQEKIKGWKNIERKFSIDKKLETIGQTVGYSIDRSRKPFQTITELFDFRDLVVHAKPETVRGDVKVHKDTGQARFPTSKWIEMCDLETATRFQTAVRDAILELHKHSNYPQNDPLLFTEKSVFSIPRKDEGD
jgi:hypothetical protein